MLGIVWKLLTFLGALLLILLGLALTLLLLILFFPVFYRLEGEKSSDTMRLVVKADWLFGCLRIRGGYPVPGRIKAKLLWHTLYDSGKKKTEEAADAEASAENEREKSRQTGRQTNPAERDETQTAVQTAETSEKEEQEAAGSTNEKNKHSEYTSDSVYDKIKAFRDKAAYYAALLQEEETKQLFSHTCFRCGKILKNIRPRRIRAELLFGTGEPDTTGYVLALYAIFSPMLGPKVCVTPDFTAAVLEGSLFAAGHVTGAALLFHACRILTDKKLRSFIDKMKAGRL